MLYMEVETNWHHHIVEKVAYNLLGVRPSLRATVVRSLTPDLFGAFSSPHPYSTPNMQSTTDPIPLSSTNPNPLLNKHYHDFQSFIISLLPRSSRKDSIAYPLKEFRCGVSWRRKRILKKNFTEKESCYLRMDMICVVVVVVVTSEDDWSHWIRPFLCQL